MPDYIYICGPRHETLVNYVEESYSRADALGRRGINVASTARLRSKMPQAASALVVFLDAQWFAGVSIGAPEHPRDYLYDLLSWAGHKSIPVFPVLLDEASMPTSNILPPDIAYLAASQARSLRTTSEEVGVDLIELLDQFLAQLGFLQMSPATVWAGLSLTLGIIATIFLAMLLSSPWPAYAVGGLMTISVIAVSVRIGYVPTISRHDPSVVWSLFACLALCIGGAYLFAANVLSDTPHSTQGVLLAILGVSMIGAGLSLYWLIAIFIGGGATIVMTPAHGLTAQAPTYNYFLSYRRDDSMVECDLIEKFLNDKGYQVFRDFNAIQFGANFEHVLERAIESSEVMLVLVGPSWLSLDDATGRRRIDDAADYVRREIAFAVEHHKRIIPITVRGARLPLPSQVPQDLVNLTYLSALNLREEHFEDDLRGMGALFRSEPAEAVRRQPLSKSIGYSVTGVVLCALASALSPHLAALPIVQPSQAQALTDELAWFFVHFGALCLITAYAAAVAKAILARRWRWLVSLAIWTMLGTLSYLTIVAHTLLIPVRFEMACLIAAWIVSIGLLGDLSLLATGLRFQVIPRRAQSR